MKPKIAIPLLIIKRQRKKVGVFFLSSAITFLLFIEMITLYTSPHFLMALGNKTFGGSPPMFYSLPIAEIAYTRASKLLDENNKPTPWSFYQLGRIAFIKGDLHLALLYFKKELDYYPNHTKVYYMKGLTLGYMGRGKEGIEAFKFYTQNTSDSWASFNDLAWLQFRAGDFSGALETIEPVAKAQPYNPWVANTYGVLLMNLGRLDEAKESLSKGQETLSSMTEADWGMAYPGNNPRIYENGLSQMKESLDSNQKLIEKKLKETPASSEQ